jgi:hypothetical protein
VLRHDRLLADSASGSNGLLQSFSGDESGRYLKLLLCHFLALDVQQALGVARVAVSSTENKEDNFLGVSRPVGCWQKQPAAAIARREYSRPTNVNSVSEFFVCPFLAVETWEALRAAQVVSNSRRVKRNTFLAQRR